MLLVGRNLRMAWGREYSWRSVMAFRASALNSWSKLPPPPPKMGESRPEGSMQGEKAISVFHSAAARGLIPGHVSLQRLWDRSYWKDKCWILLADGIRLQSLCSVRFRINLVRYIFHVSYPSYQKGKKGCYICQPLGLEAISPTRDTHSLNFQSPLKQTNHIGNT